MGMYNHCVAVVDIDGDILESYPWWAAVVWEEDSSEIPLGVLNMKAGVVRTEPGPLTLVQFYDKTKSWYVVQTLYFLDLDLCRQWLELSSLRELGEDKGKLIPM